MASLRAKYSRRLLKSAGQYQSHLSSTSRRLQSSLTSAAGLPVEVVPTRSGYEIPVDKATSTFTPVPTRVQDGSQDILPAAAISGAPVELQARAVRIYKEAKPASQSGDFRTERWRMDWDILAKGHRWENPLMGWQSSGDFMQGTHVNFKSKEDAIHFAEKQGYEYFVQEPNSRKFTPKAYANNFLYSPRKLKHIRTK